MSKLRSPRLDCSMTIGTSCETMSWWSITGLDPLLLIDATSARSGEGSRQRLSSPAFAGEVDRRRRWRGLLRPAQDPSVSPSDRHLPRKSGEDKKEGRPIAGPPLPLPSGETLSTSRSAALRCCCRWRRWGSGRWWRWRRRLSCRRRRRRRGRHIGRRRSGGLGAQLHTDARVIEAARRVVDRLVDVVNVAADAARRPGVEHIVHANREADVLQPHERRVLAQLNVGVEDRLHRAVVVVQLAQVREVAAGYRGAELVAVPVDRPLRLPLGIALPAAADLLAGA